MTWAELRRRLRRSWRRAVARWRRSIQLRVVATTLVLSIVVVVLLGALLLNQVTEGLLDAKQRTAVAEASAGFRSAQEQLNAATSSDPASVGNLIGQLAESLASRGGRAGLYEVVVLSTNSDRAAATASAPRASGEVQVESVPARLRGEVSFQRPAYTYTGIRYREARTVPGLAVGEQVQVPGVGVYELYYLFPLTQERDTLGLVRRTLATAGLFLVVLLGAIAWVVTRQVVTPVRMAARIAERLSAGRLEERMRVRGEDDLARLASSFNRMATNLQGQIRQLEDLSRVQRRFVSDVSHELRTPLTTVRMAADVLHESRTDFGPAVRRSAELLQTQLDRFEALLADLLEISRFDAGAAVLETEALDLRDVVHRVVDAYHPLAERKGSRIVVRTDPAPCVADVDGRRVERVVRNLVVNAVEHGEGRDVVVRVAADDRAVAVVVRDHGVGLRPGEASLVFNRFWRADPARARTTGGSGLGLSIALEDAHLHNGWLQAWGDPGAGSQFRLTLPRRRGAELDGSPIPLVPEDSRRSAATDAVGAPASPQGRVSGVGSGGA